MYCAICREWIDDVIDDDGTYFNDCGHYVCQACMLRRPTDDCPRCEWLDDEWSDEWDEGNGG